MSYIVENPIVIPLMLNSHSGVGVRDGVGKLSNIKYPTNQISESRAFYHMKERAMHCRYIGFTTYRHNIKFVKEEISDQQSDRSFKWDCIKLEDIDLALIEKCFKNSNVRAVSFFPEDRFLIRADRYHPGMTSVLVHWLEDKYKMSPKQIDAIFSISKNKYVPACNSFIMRSADFLKYFNFLDDFLAHIDSLYGLDKFSLNIPVCEAHKGREWGLFTERLIGLYMIVEYGDKFRIAFVDEKKKYSHFT